MAAPTDNKELKLAPDAGALATDTYFAVQQDSATGIIQRLKQSVMAITTAITGQGFLDDKRFITPKGLGATVGSETNPGIVELASDSEIVSKSGTKVLSAEKMDKIFQEGIQQTGNIIQNDVDAGATQGTVTVGNVIGSTYGQMGHYEGSFAYESDSNDETKNIYFDNVRQPLQTVVGHGHYSRSDKASTLKFPFTCTFTAAGTPTNGLGRVLMNINTGIEGLNWSTGITYSIDFAIDYLAVI
jgi:hypothetical protein